MKRLLFILAILVCGASVLTACMSIDDNAVTKDDNHAKKALLIVLDGWGIGDKGLGASVIGRFYAMDRDKNWDRIKLAYDLLVDGKGLKQLHIAETEKYAHVTSFINGGREEPFTGEDRILADVAPSVLHIMGLQQPKEMTGQCLINE